MLDFYKSKLNPNKNKYLKIKMFRRVKLGLLKKDMSMIIQDHSLEI